MSDCYYSMNWIIPGKLAVGDKDAAGAIQELKKKGIKLVVTVREELSRSEKQYKDNGISVLHIVLSDFHRTNIGKFFPYVFTRIDKIIEDGGAVLVNCYAGISRSTTLIVSYLMRKFAWTAKEAKEHVKTYRPCFDPNTGFLKQLNDYEIVLYKHGFYSENHKKNAMKMYKKWFKKS